MNLIGVHASHHMCGGLADFDVLQQGACAAVKHRQLRVKPLRLINDRLADVRPHIVGVVHIDCRQ